MAPQLPRGVESFTPLLQYSLNGFAVVDGDGRYAWVSDSLCLLLAMDKHALLGRHVTSLVFSSDRKRLAELLSAARERASVNKPTDDFARVRHACGVGVARTGGTEGATQRHIPVECKVCADSEYAYMVVLDARVPTRLEGLLPDFLLYTSHDLRTPCCSIQSATAVLLTMPTVAADVDAASLLNSIDAACAVLLRTVSNVLQIRALQRDGALTMAPPQLCALEASIKRAVAMVCAFGGEPPRISWTNDVDAPLPDRVLVDPAALDACLQNVLLAAVRLGAWQPTRSAVRLHVATEPATESAELAGVVELHITAQGCSPEDCPPDMFHLIISAETPGRPLTRSECDTLLTQFGMAPPDKGGGTGLALFVARGLARGMGGDLFVDTDREDATSITARLPLRVPSASSLKHVSPPTSPAGSSNSDSGSSSEGSPGATMVDEVELTSRMFECLLTNSDDVFAICRLSADADGLGCVVDYISPSVERGLAFCQQAVVGASLLSVCLPEDRPAFVKAISAAHRGEGPHGHNLECMHRSITGDGGSIWCHTFGLCVDDVLYLVCRDIRARKSVEIAMRAFTLATTHDLRECCNAVLVSTAMLEKRDCIAGSSASPPPSPDTSRVSAAAAAAAAAEDVPLEPCFLVSCIRTACGLITGIIGNVLTAPQVEEGHLELEAEVFSPKATLRDVLQACRMGCAAAAQPGGSTIEWEEADDEARKLPPLVECDRKRLAQVLQNVITNACKFGLGNPVTVHGELDALEVDERPWLCVRVRDRGRGMSADEVASCFGKGQAASKAAGGGTGLGLYLSRAFAELLGGTLRVAETHPGGGSVFELRIPVRVLTADEVAAVTAAQEELAAAAAEDARAARHRVSAAAAAAAAGVTTAAAADDAVVLVSPCSSTSSGGSTKSHFHVLLADDHMLNLRLVSRLLQLQGFDVTSVADGSTALDVLRSNALAQAAGSAGPVSIADATPFDLAILDMNMPGMSGPDVAAAFRRFEAESMPGAMRLPIIALTANVMEEHAAECATAGMDLFLSKPLRPCSVPVLQAHAAAHAEYRAVQASARSATSEAVRAAASAAAAASVARATLGIGALEPCADSFPLEPATPQKKP